MPKYPSTISVAFTFHPTALITMPDVSLQTSTGPSPSLKMQSKMMAYDHVVSELNASRLRGTSFPIVHALIQASLSSSSDVSISPDRTVHSGFSPRSLGRRV